MNTPDSRQERRKRAVAGVGRIIVWPGASVWIGHDVGVVPDHAHHAIQVSLSMEGRFRIRARGWAEWLETTSAVVMPDITHQLDGGGTAVATLFVEPDSRPGAALRQRFGHLDIGVLVPAEVEAAVAGLRQHYQAGATDDVLRQHAQGAICRIAGDTTLAPASDPRITAALAWMRGQLATPLRLEDVARVVHLSPSRFRHLFVAQTGTSFRAWLLWARAEAAIAAGMRGKPWSDAAQEAGFKPPACRPQGDSNPPPAAGQKASTPEQKARITEQITPTSEQIAPTPGQIAPTPEQIAPTSGQTAPTTMEKRRARHYRSPRTAARC
ncbi:MAG: helix-turn-helix domain-containing protein, partial [Acetobacteraceae bacterium]